MKIPAPLMAGLVEEIAWPELTKPFYRTQHESKVLKLLCDLRDAGSEGHTKQYPA